MSTKPLEAARRRVAEAEQRIAEQRTRLTRLRESDEDITDAEALLETFHDSLDVMLPISPWNRPKLQRSRSGTAPPMNGTTPTDDRRFLSDIFRFRTSTQRVPHCPMTRERK